MPLGEKASSGRSCWRRCNPLQAGRRVGSRATLCYRMRDLLDILTAAERLASAGEAATLATVVRVEGSSYRLPGARMLVDAAGRRTGSVSGGCLESDVARRGRLLSSDRPSMVVRYDASDDGSGEDAAWGFALGCNGSIDVLIERVVPTAPTASGLAFLQRCLRDRRRGAVLHVFPGGRRPGRLARHAAGGPGRRVGRRRPRRAGQPVRGDVD